MNTTGLRLDWCSYAAAKYAMEHWYYRPEMPRGKLVKIGVWEEARFVGAVLFGCGAGGATNGRRFGLAERFEMAEMVRVAMTTHRAPMSRILRVALMMLVKQSPGLRLVISYADPTIHHGGIYQAGNWIYSGTSTPDCVYIDARGGRHHSRTVHTRGVTRRWNGRLMPCPRPQDFVRAERVSGKHVYLYPLDAAMRVRLAAFAQPYPRADSIAANAPAVQVGEDGSTPISALKSERDQPARDGVETGAAPHDAI